MHFCVFATRLYCGFSSPRKYGLNWFIPALAKSNVLSLSGTTGEDGTKWCPCFLQKKSMNCWRISLDEGMGYSGVARDSGPGLSHERTRIQGESSRGLGGLGTVMRGQHRNYERKRSCEKPMSRVG